eukprot:5133621-Amphidinium_carterae.1
MAKFFSGCLRAGEQPPRLLPLVCEHAFNFPPKDMQPQLEALSVCTPTNPKRLTDFSGREEAHQLSILLSRKGKPQNR